MELSSRCWHLRWVRCFTPDYTPRDLCRYFWTLFWHLSLVPLAYILSWPSMWLAIWVDRQHMKLSASQHQTWKPFVPTGKWMVLAAVFMPVAFLVILSQWTTLMEENDLVKHPPKAKKSDNLKSPGFRKLAWAFIMAKKKGLCPLITVREE